MYNCFYSNEYLTAILLFLEGIQLLSIAVLAIYTRKIYRELKDHPRLPIENTNVIESASDEKIDPRSNWWKEATYFIRHAGSGVANTIVGFIVIFYAMSLGFSPVVSNVAGYAVGFVLGFILSKKFVFRSNGHFVGESVLYLIAFIISFLFNLLILRLALNYLNINVVVSQVAAAVAYTLLMYILTRLFVFSTLQ